MPTAARRRPAASSRASSWCRRGRRRFAARSAEHHRLVDAHVLEVDLRGLRRADAELRLLLTGHEARRVAPDDEATHAGASGRWIGLRPHDVDRRALAVRDPLLAAADDPVLAVLRAAVLRPEMSEPVPGSDSAIAATLMWPLLVVAVRAVAGTLASALRCPCATTGDAARPEPPIASAMPAQPHASSSRARDREPRLALRLLRIGIFVDAGQLLAARRPSTVWVMPNVAACFISAHGIDSLRRARSRSARIACFANAFEHLANAGEQRVVVKDVHGYAPFCASTRPSRSSPWSASNARASRISFSTG